MITAVVFAAGRGTRLLPITETIPKPLVPLLDVALVDIAVGKVREVSGRTIVNVSHLGDRVLAHLTASGSEAEVLDEGSGPFGTGGTLAALRDRLSGTVLTYNCDLVSDLSPDELLSTHRASGRMATVACIPVTEKADLVDEHGTLSLVDRRVTAAAGYRFTGAALWEASVLDRLPDRRPLGLTEGLLAPLLDRKEVGLFIHEGFAEDAGTRAGLLHVAKAALAGKVRIPHPGTILGGSSYVGPGASVEEGSLGPNSVIGAGAEVALGAQISDTIVWPGEKVPPIELEKGIWFEGRLIPV